ncbi:hypothetical protein [Lacrimispora celerecrescens]|mgnify:CR=1 FL=1|uniref:Putative cell wall binding repeat protein n=1 Tax=[Clostridium] celerecrescens 18A TaxID=1286362 RepID=A0A2M8Z0K4_9FIRM|nr:hypothetical protein [Lacrimispora celerecrescens]PJJ26978.1 putative cell wall binding repeat protein [[Clostridium] celerecrescens 18A]
MYMLKRFAAFITAAILSVIPITALAATGTQISSVSLYISSEIEAGESGSDVTVTSSSSKFSIDDVEVTNIPDEEWKDGNKPKLKVTLEAEDDYYFASGFSKSSVSLSGSDGTVSSVSRSSSELIVYITLDALDDDENDHELAVSNLEWDESNGTGFWDESEDANKYEVRLYRGSNAVTSALTTTYTSYDFSSYMTNSGTYSFKVRGVYNSSNKGSWEESDSWYVSSDVAEEIRSKSSSGVSGPGSGTGAGAWLKDRTGWWYCNADKSYTVSNWQYIDDCWYYFNGSGYMVTGWVNWNSIWYYCGESGAMLINTTTPDGYEVGSDGAWIQS